MKTSFEDILNRRIDTAIKDMKEGDRPSREKDMKEGDRPSREKAQKKYQVLADIRASIARQKFYERHSTGKLKDL